MADVYLEYVDDKSSKFWEISVQGRYHTVTYGRIGSEGQSKTKEFEDAAAAEADAQKLIASKKKKGYAEAKVGASRESSGGGAKRVSRTVKAKKAPPQDTNEALDIVECSQCGEESLHVYETDDPETLYFECAACGYSFSGDA